MKTVCIQFYICCSQNNGLLININLSVIFVKLEDLLNNYYLKQPEPIQSCLLALRDIILNVDENISKQRKFQIPFFYYGDKKLAFLWVTRKKIMLGFVEDKNIYPKQKGVRVKDKIDAIYVDPNLDIPIKMIEKKIKALIKLYESL